MKRRAVSQQEIDAYVERCQTGSCFVCDIVARRVDEDSYIVYEDAQAIAFLNKYPTLYGYTLVAPRAHREQVTGDFAPDEYLTLQRVIYIVGEAVRREVKAERVYILSLGSQQGNRHVHWHVAPLPPGVPYEKQQLEALKLADGVVELSDEEKTALAERLRRRIQVLAREVGL